MARVTERLRWLLLVLTLIGGLGAMTVFNVLYTNSVERGADRDFCALLAVFDDPDAPPPTTERGRRQVAAIRDYRAKRC
jgi:hypothetical protein